MDNIISKEIIDNALQFYNITDKDYKNKCYECLDDLLSNNNLFNSFKELYKVLYLDHLDRAKVKKLWSNKNIDDLFGKNCHPFITNLMLLSGYIEHIANISKYNLDEKQKELHIKRVRDSLLNDIIERNYPGIRISQMLWGAYFVNIRLIELGRLQYELCYHNPIKDEVQEKCIKIHIPKGTKLYMEYVIHSISDSKLQIEKYFNLQNPNYYCTSWLLSPQLHEILNENSNIYKFYELFDISTSNEDATSDILNFVFGLKECNNFESLSENTSLQKKLKEMLINNVPITIGIGKLKQI